jgi:hypothetical protein
VEVPPQATDGLLGIMGLGTFHLSIMQQTLTSVARAEQLVCYIRDIS